MSAVATTRMSSKGQVVIPEEVRNRLGFSAGDRFVVVGEDDVVILKAITPPSMDDFDGIIRRARSQAKAARMKPSDVTAAVARVRGHRQCRPAPSAASGIAPSPSATATCVCSTCPGAVW